MEIQPRFFASDAGNEFNQLNKEISNILKNNYRMKMYILKGKTKGSIVERWNRTLKTRLARYFTHNKTKRWVDVLEQFTNNINNTVNRTTGMAPSTITIDNFKPVKDRLFPDERTDEPCELKINDIVRVFRTKGLYDKGYEQK